MIKLRDILKEFDYGKLLFADPDSNALSTLEPRWQYKFKDFIKRHLDGTEPNTPEEDKLFAQVVQYLRYAETVSDLTPLKSLLALKSKFPKILDPLQDPSYPNNGYIYRGATIPTEDLLELVVASNVQYSEGNKGDYLTINANGKKVTSKSTRGALSFSFSRKVAERFVQQKGDEGIPMEILARKFPIIMQCNISAMSSKLLFTPSFLYSVSKFDEQETWYFDNSFSCDNIIMPSFMNYNDFPWPRDIKSAADLESSRYPEYPPILVDLMKATKFINI